MKKLNKTNLKIRNKTILKDAILVTIAGIAAAMKNTG
jgi:phosphoenolpyruvate carboxylase